MISSVSQRRSHDEELSRRVAAYLTSLQRAPLRGIRVAAADGRVTLAGRVGSFYEKQLCLGCVHQVKGVDALTDHIEVD